MPHILHIDDSEYHLDLVRELLTSKGYEVTSEVDPWRGLKSCQGDEDPPFDLIITDLSMEKIDGFTFIKMLRESVINPPPIIINTSQPYTKEFTFLAKGLDVVAWVKKPSANQEILSCVNQVFNLNKRTTVRKVPEEKKVLFVSTNLEKFSHDHKGVVIDESLGGCCLAIDGIDLEVGSYVLIRIENFDFFAKVMWKKLEEKRSCFGFSLVPEDPRFESAV